METEGEKRYMAFLNPSGGRFEYGAFLEVVYPDWMRTKAWIDVGCGFDRQSCSFGGVYAVLDEADSDMWSEMNRHWRFELEDHCGYWQGYCLRSHSRCWRVLTWIYLALLLAPLWRIHR